MGTCKTSTEMKSINQCKNFSYCFFYSSIGNIITHVGGGGGEGVIKPCTANLDLLLLLELLLI